MHQMVKVTSKQIPKYKNDINITPNIQLLVNRQKSHLSETGNCLL